MTPSEAKQTLVIRIQQMKQDTAALTNLLKQATPNAGQLLVSRDIEKLQRVLDKVQMGIGSLVV